MRDHAMSDATITRDATAGEPRDTFPDDLRDDDLAPPHADDFDITDLQHWIDLCA
jgi:hypothetical protein